MVQPYFDLKTCCIVNNNKNITDKAVLCLPWYHFLWRLKTYQYYAPHANSSFLDKSPSLPSSSWWRASLILLSLFWRKLLREYFPTNQTTQHSNTSYPSCIGTPPPTCVSSWHSKKFELDGLWWREKSNRHPLVEYQLFPVWKKQTLHSHFS